MPVMSQYYRELGLISPTAADFSTYTSTIDLNTFDFNLENFLGFVLFCVKQNIANRQFEVNERKSTKNVNFQNKDRCA